MTAKQSKLCAYRRCTRRFRPRSAAQKFCHTKHAVAERNARTSDKVAALGKKVCAYRNCKIKFQPKTTRQIYCRDKCRQREGTAVAADNPKPTKAERVKLPGRKCSCGCGDPVMDGNWFLGERCFKTKRNDAEDWHGIN